MRVKNILLIICFTLLFASCEKQMTVPQKIEMIEAERRHVYADLVRHEAECRATSVEFPTTPELLSACLETHRFMVDAAQRTIESIDKRIGVLAPKPDLIPFNGKLDGEK
jgi:hypothetical protein